MALFDCMPDEVLLNIISHLDHSIRDLAALSGQCRRFYSFIDMPTRKRFHRIRLRRQTIRQGEYTTQRLLEILKQPKLGQYVRQLELSPPPQFADLIRPYDEPEDEVTKLFMATMRVAGFSDSKDLRILLSKFLVGDGLRCYDSFRGDKSSGARLLAGSDEAAAVLLITLCPNIDMLKIAHVMWPVEDLLKSINSKNSTSGSLQKLREVRLINEAYDERDYGVFGFLESMRYFHRLPSIESIHLDCATLGEGDYFHLAPKRSNFSKILIDHSSFSSHELATIIRHPKALEEFRFNVGGRSVMEISDCNVQPKVVGRALQTQKSSLRVLDLDLDSIIYYNVWSEEPDELQSEEDEDESNFEMTDSDFEDAGISTPSDVDKSVKFGRTIGSFHDFTALTHLSIGVKLLIGLNDRWDRWRDEEDEQKDFLPAKYCLVERLPPNLEYLCLRGFNKDVDKAYALTIFQFMEMREERLPSLKEVRGVDEYIPSAKSVESPDDEPHLLWEDTDSWAEGESSDPNDIDASDSDANDHGSSDSKEDHV